MEYVEDKFSSVKDMPEIVYRGCCVDWRSGVVDTTSRYLVELQVRSGQAIIRDRARFTAYFIYLECLPKNRRKMLVIFFLSIEKVEASE
jgi:hypothetical protein